MAFSLPDPLTRKMRVLAAAASAAGFSYDDALTEAGWVPAHMIEAKARELSARPPSNDMTIATVIREGELGVTEGETVQHVLDSAAAALDSACAHDISGEVLFKGADGQYYTASTEIVIARAAPTFVRDTLEACVDEFCTCEHIDDVDRPHDADCPSRELVADLMSLRETLSQDPEPLSL